MSARFEPIAERYLTPVIRGSVEYMCECPFCDGTSSLQFNIDNGLWVCFRCDAKGNAERLVRRLGGVYADPVVGVETIRRHMDRIRMLRKKKETAHVALSDSYLSRYRFDDPYWTDIRGFSNEAIKEFDLGYDPLSDRHTIAYRDSDGTLLGVIQRLKGKNIFPRYIYPEGFDRKNSMFGSWKITTRKCGIVEGSTDVIALWDAERPALGQYGSSISNGQARLLHRLGVKELVMFYDYDEAGRKAEERSREAIEGIILRTVLWDKDKYCWHEKLCGCGEHTWRTIGKCLDKKKCNCKR
jgi:DNA primase